MITSRWITLDDLPLIKQAIEHDEYHIGGKAEFFYEAGSCCNVYEDEDGPIMFLRGQVKPDEESVVCIDIQFMSNLDSRRNMSALFRSYEVFVPNCRAHGFKELVFSTKSPKLKRFCTKYLGFAEVEEKMHKAL